MEAILYWSVKPRWHSRGFRAGCTWENDPCTTGSTTLPRPGTSVPGRERPWATAWRFSTGSEFFSWGKKQSRFFLSGAQTCLFVSWRPWLWHERDKALTTATSRARKVFAFKAGCRRIAAGCHRIWGGPAPARHVYRRFKDVSETVLTGRPAALTHSNTVLRRSTDGQSRLWDASRRLSRSQGTLASGCRTTHGCEAVVIWSCRVFNNRV